MAAIVSTGNSLPAALTVSVTLHHLTQPSSTAWCLAALGALHDVNSHVDSLHLKPLLCAGPHHVQVRMVHHGTITLSSAELLTFMRYQQCLNNTINWSNKVGGLFDGLGRFWQSPQLCQARSLSTRIIVEIVLVLLWPGSASIAGCSHYAACRRRDCILSRRSHSTFQMRLCVAVAACQCRSCWV